MIGRLATWRPFVTELPLNQWLYLYLLPFVRFAKWQFGDKELRNCHPAIRQTFPKADKRNLRYFKITNGVIFITAVFLIEFITLFTKPSDCLPPAGIPSRDHSPIHGVGDFFHSTGIVPGKAGNGSTGSFVNHAVYVTTQWQAEVLKIND